MPRKVFSLDCGTTNWRIAVCNYREAPGTEAVYELRGEPQPLSLSIFDSQNHSMAATLVLNKNEEIACYGQNAYDYESESKENLALCDHFKLSIGNFETKNFNDPRRRYTHQEALCFTRLLLTEVAEQLIKERIDVLSDSLLIFCHPIHWGRETFNGQIRGSILEDFSKIIYKSFPAAEKSQIHFITEPEAALLSLMQSGQLDLSKNENILIIDIGGGTTDFISGRWTSQGLENPQHYGGIHGGGLFDHDLAEFIAELFEIQNSLRESKWSEILKEARVLKEMLSQEVNRNKSNSVKISKNIFLDLGENGNSVLKKKKIMLTPEVFEMRTQETCKSLESLVLKSLGEMNLKATDVNQVVLVGGGARLYIVRQILAEIFDNSTPLVYSYPPERAVANGATLWLSRPKFENSLSSYKDNSVLVDVSPKNLIRNVYKPLFQTVFQDPFEPFQDLGYS